MTLTQGVLGCFTTMLSKRYRDPISVLYRFDMADVQLLNAFLMVLSCPWRGQR